MVVPPQIIQIKAIVVLKPIETYGLGEPPFQETPRLVDWSPKDIKPATSVAQSPSHQQLTYLADSPGSAGHFQRFSALGKEELKQNISKMEINMY